MAQDRTERSISEIASAVGVDVAYLTPPGESHFDPVSLSLGFASVMLIAFFTGFVDQSRKDSRDAGMRTARWLRDRVAALFQSHPPSGPVETRQAAKDAADVAAKAKQDDAHHYSDSSQAILESFLLEEGFPKAKASTIAKKVRLEADLLMSVKP